jgi:hypothetical protein
LFARKRRARSIPKGIPMNPKPPERGPVRKSLRPSLERVEQRRRELIEDTGIRWWHTAPLARAAAASILGFFCVSLAVCVAMTANASIVAIADPAYAMTLPAVHGKTARARSHRTIHHAGVRHRKLAHAARFAHTRRDPTPAPSATTEPTMTPAITTTAAPSQTPATLLSAQPWTLTADGTWTTVVSLALPPGVDKSKLSVTYSSADADVVPLDANAPLAPGAIVTIGFADRDVQVVAAASDPAIGSVTLAVAPPSSDPSTFGAVAQPIGPHLVSVGWTPFDPSLGVQQLKIYRRAAGVRHGSLVASVSPDGTTWHDDSVAPATSYTYSVVAALPDHSLRASTGFVATPPSLPATSIDAVSGKGMFLYFSPNVSDGIGYAKFDPDAIVARAKTAGITHIEVRMARGTFFEAGNPGVTAWLNALIDKAAAANIKLIAWQVPRRSSSADEATAVAAARYATPAGNGFAGLALDIEDGDNYMGVGEAAKQRMVDDIETVRHAVGGDYVVIATVMSPALTHWTNARYPFSRIAPFATVLQPMEYWHHFYSSSHHAYSQDEVTSACADSVALTRQVAGRDMPINVAGQSDDLGTTGPPSPQEIGWCLTGSKSAGAIGQTFFDWRGTNDDNWTAIAGFVW